jgi:hypothetical protein
MPWLGSLFVFTTETISRLAPAVPGVYLLWRRGVWVYIGATENIRVQLLALAAGESECVSREAPTDFGFEVITASERRDARLQGLTDELQPVCRHHAVQPS